MANEANTEQNTETTEGSLTLDALEERFRKMEARMQKIASDHAGRGAAKLEKTIGELVERFNGLTETQQAAPDASKVENTPQWAEMKKLVAQQQATIESMRKEAERERQGRRDVEAISQIRAAAAKHGVRPGLVDALTAHLYESKAAKLKYAEDGRLVFHSEPGVELDPDQGIAEYFKTDKGKEWLAPVEASGSGATRPQRSSNGTSGGFSAAEIAAAILGSGQ